MGSHIRMKMWVNKWAGGQIGVPWVNGESRIRVCHENPVHGRFQTRISRGQSNLDSFSSLSRDLLIVSASPGLTTSLFDIAELIGIHHNHASYFPGGQ